MTRRARVTPSGMSTRPRKKRVAAGASAAGSPSGNQIQEASSSAGAPTSSAGAPIHCANQSDRSVRPVSHQDGSLHAEALPAASQTRTDQ